MAKSFFFYDLETTGFNPREGRITQFGGQRTDLSLKPIGESINILIKMTSEVLPDPEAVLLTGITPQRTIRDGLSEADFLSLFEAQANKPGTIFVGYNNIRFDDEFMRFLFYRNLYDPYVWQWQDDRSRWDLIDLVRMTRALRPKGINWPVDSQGKPSNQLGLVAKANDLEHKNAHDALSDVLATIEVARLVHDKQPKLFDFSLNHRSKKVVAQFIESNDSFIYTSSKYSSEFANTAIVQSLGSHPTSQGILVYDLRRDPSDFLGLSAEQLAEVWRYDPLERRALLPIKTLLFNRCPVVAPLSVLDEESKSRLKVDMTQIEANRQLLLRSTDFVPLVKKALTILDKERDTQQRSKGLVPVDAQLYDDFFSNNDRQIMDKLHETEPSLLAGTKFSFSDSRLNNLFDLYLARNYPDTLTSDQLVKWENFRRKTLGGVDDDSKLVKYLVKIDEVAKRPGLSANNKKLLEELRQWADAIRPSDGVD